MNTPSYLLFTILVVITTIQYSGSQGEITSDVWILVWLDENEAIQHMPITMITGLLQWNV